MGIYQRFLAPFVVAVLLGTFVAWWVGGVLYSTTLERRLSQQLLHAAAVLAAGRLPLTSELLRNLAELLQAEVYLLGTDGGISPAGDPARLRVIRDAHERWRHAEDPVQKVPGPSPLLLVFHGLDAHRDDRYTSVALVADLSDLRRTAQVSAGWLAGGALAGVLLLSWVASRIGRSLTRPIEQLAAMADRIAQGDRQVRTRIDRRDELGTLARSLNSMAERLAAYEQELLEKKRLATLGTVAARVAHEIRNPLTAIKLQIQLLGEHLQGDQRRLVEGLEDEIGRLELIVSGVVSQGRPLTVELRPTDLNILVDEVARLFGPQLAHLEIGLTTEFQPLPLLALDPERFKQIIVNLLVNARDALPEGGHVRLGTWVEPDRRTVSLVADDSGPGLALEPEQDPFQRTESAKPYGLGLGLRLCRELVEAHGGTIRIGTAPLGGARVQIQLPLPTEAP